MFSNDTHRLAEIIELIDLIRSHMDGCSRQAFLQDRHKIDATAYRLQAIGEATIYLSAEFKDAHPLIPWPDIRDMRNLLSHQYGKVDPTIIWSVITMHLDSLYDVCVGAG